QNPYPKAFTGHVRATLRDGTVVEERQPHMRGGAQEPLTREDIEDKFRLNARHGGWSEAHVLATLRRLGSFFDEAADLAALRG
ncbi:MAG TPA: MmgE/PrpD family protein, partial [Xanthobacteraceae bacterium]|nr:MmgE/PrpD family protein [Xanthobacteraceae bacterium]